MSSRSFRIGRSVSGLGLFAIKAIKRGAYIATYRGRRITTEEADRREVRGARYQFELNKRWTIDGSPRWNLARYINHSCRPNAKPVGRKGGIVIVAQRRIEPGDEITYDYGREYVKYFLENGGCRCAACRRKRALRRREAACRCRIIKTVSHRWKYEDRAVCWSQRGEGSLSSVHRGGDGNHAD
jgi:SET domain-containing protein